MGVLSSAWGSWQNMTITLANLATSSTLLVGRASDAVDLSGAGNLLDVQVCGHIVTGTGPAAASQIEVWLYGDISNATVTYPDGISATDAAATLASDDVKYQSFGGPIWKGPFALMKVLNTTGKGYDFGPWSIKSWFGDCIPKLFGVFVTHNTGVNLNAAGHAVRYRTVYGTY